MYERPQLKRYGSLRELTEAGWNGDSDGWFLRIADGTNLDPVVCDILGQRCTS